MPIVLNGTSGVTDVDGTAAAPALTGTTSTNTGIFFPAANTLGFSTNGAEVGRFDSSGRLLINQTSATYGSPIELTSNTSGIGIVVHGRASDGTGVIAFTANGASTEYARVQSDNTSALLFGTGSSGTERARIDSSGNFLVGVTSSTYKFYVSDTNDRTESTAQFRIAGSGYSFFTYLDATACYLGQNSNSRELRMYSGGTPTTGVKLTAGATSWASTSDEREKDIIEHISDATQKLSGLRAVIGKYKTDDEKTRRSFLIAQDVKSVFPEAISEDGDGILSLRYTDLIPVLVKAVQELKAELDSVKAELAALKP